MSPPTTPSAASPQLPIHIWRGATRPLVEWAPLDGSTFAEPFFDQTVTAALQSPLTLLRRHTTSVEALITAAADRPAVRPDGLIFHVSRCGSTLVAQMLARLPGSRVLAEPQPVVRLLEDPRLAPETRLAALRAFVTLLAPPADADGRRPPFALKLDPRNLLDWPTVRIAFPDVPSVVVHRDPLEVLVSNLDSLPAGLLPGEIAFEKLGAPAQPLQTAEDYAAFVLSRFYAAAGALAREPGVLAVDYLALPTAVESHVLPHFGLPGRLAPADLVALRAAAGIYAKDATRSVTFVPDSAAKRATASAEMHDLCARWIQPAAEQLRRPRASGPTP